MFFLTFTKLYQNCTIFLIDRDPAPFPTKWKKSLNKVSVSTQEKVQHT